MKNKLKNILRKIVEKLLDLTVRLCYNLYMTMKLLKPLGKQVLLKWEELENKKSAGGILLPDTLKRRHYESSNGKFEYKVVAVGPQVDIPCLEVGYTCLPKVNHGGQWCNDNYLVVDQEDIIAIQ